MSVASTSESQPQFNPANTGVGSLEIVHVTTHMQNHHCFRWRINEIESYIQSQQEMKSPIFIVREKEKCKWRLNLKCTRTGTGTGAASNIISALHMVLDRTSDCKEASAKFKLSILGYRTNLNHECNLQSARTFKFATKGENSTGILSSVPGVDSHEYSRHMQMNLVRMCAANVPGTRQLMSRIASGIIFTITCEIMIERIYLEDDTLSNDFGSLFENKLCADFTILVGEKQFQVHKAILAGRSSVFAAMLAQDMKEKEGVVCISDMDENVVEEMLRYIYTGQVEKWENVAQDLLAAADKYDLKGLRIVCEGKLIASLSSSNVFDLLFFAKFNNAYELKSAAIDFIANTSKELLRTTTYEALRQSDPQLVLEICDALLKDRITEK